MDDTRDAEYNKLYVCIVKTCPYLKHRRGLCSGHYNTARRLIKGRKTSWEKLISSGDAMGRGFDKEAAEKYFLREACDEVKK